MRGVMSTVGEDPYEPGDGVIPTRLLGLPAPRFASVIECYGGRLVELLEGSGFTVEDE